MATAGTATPPDSSHAVGFAPDADRQRLQAFFAATPDTDTSQRWDEIWKEDFLPFDRNTPNPALDEALARYLSPSSTSPGILPPPIADPATGRRRAALVPGCGRGYDPLLLAAWGYDAIGLEISPTACLAAWELKGRVERAVVHGEADVPGLTPEHLAVYATRDPHGVGRGSARFVVGDFFGNPADWAVPAGMADRDPATANMPIPHKFDVVVDYTFLCAFPPSMRPRWAHSMKNKLATAAESRLVCVEFPTYKDPKIRGPPWSMPSENYLAVLGRPGEEPQYDENKRVILAEEDRKTLESGKPVTPDGMVRVDHYKATKTHAAGKDTDHVGVWKRAQD